VNERPLTGWQEIADYLKTSVRTAQRREKEGLPIHRPGNSERGPKGAVYAYPSEINDWVRGKSETSEIEDPLPIPTVSATRQKTVLRIKDALGAHPYYVLLWSFLYSSFYGTAVILEVSYELPRFSGIAFIGAPLNFIVVFLSTLMIFRWLDSLLQVKVRYAQLIASLAIVAVGTISVLIFGWLLPNRPVTLAEFQTLSADTAYLKTTSYALFIGIVLMVSPYAVVRALEIAIERGEVNQIFRLLSGDRSVPAPPGAIYLRPWMLVGVFVLSAVVALTMMAHLLDNLIASEFTWLFQRILWFRMILFVFLGIATCLWFWINLNDLKRQCSRAESTSEDESGDWAEGGALT